MCFYCSLSHFYIISMGYISTKRKRKKGKKKQPLGVYLHSAINFCFSMITSLFPSPCLCPQQEVRVGSTASTPFRWPGGGVGCARLYRRGNKNETELGTERSLRNSVKARGWGNLWLWILPGPQRPVRGTSELPKHCQLEWAWSHITPESQFVKSQQGNRTIKNSKKELKVTPTEVSLEESEGPTLETCKSL